MDAGSLTSSALLAKCWRSVSWESSLPFGIVTSLPRSSGTLSLPLFFCLISLHNLSVLKRLLLLCTGPSAASGLGFSAFNFWGLRSPLASLGLYHSLSGARALPFKWFEILFCSTLFHNFAALDRFLCIGLSVAFGRGSSAFNLWGLRSPLAFHWLLHSRTGVRALPFKGLPILPFHWGVALCLWEFSNLWGIFIPPPTLWLLSVSDVWALPLRDSRLRTFGTPPVLPAVRCVSHTSRLVAAAGSVSESSDASHLLGCAWRGFSPNWFGRWDWVPLAGFFVCLAWVTLLVSAALPCTPQGGTSLGRHSAVQSASSRTMVIDGLVAASLSLPDCVVYTVHYTVWPAILAFQFPLILGLLLAPQFGRLFCLFLGNLSRHSLLNMASTSRSSFSSSGIVPSQYVIGPSQWDRLDCFGRGYPMAIDLSGTCPTLSGLMRSELVMPKLVQVPGSPALQRRPELRVLWCASTSLSGANISAWANPSMGGLVDKFSAPVELPGLPVFLGRETVLIPWDKLLLSSWLLVRLHFSEVLTFPPSGNAPVARGPLPSARLPSSGGGLPCSGTGPSMSDSEFSRTSLYSGLSPFFVPHDTARPDYAFNSVTPGTQLVSPQGHTPLSVCRALLLLVYGSLLAMIAWIEPLWAGRCSPPAQKFSGILRRRHCLPRLAGGSGRGGIRRVSRSKSGSGREASVSVVHIRGAVGRSSDLHSWFRKEADNKFHFPHAVTHGTEEGTYVASFRSQGEFRAFMREFGQYTSPSPWLGVPLQYSAAPTGSGDSATPIYTGSIAPARPKGGYGDGPKNVAFKLDSESSVRGVGHSSSSSTDSRKRAASPGRSASSTTHQEVVDVSTDDSAQGGVQPSSSSGNSRKRAVSPGTSASSTVTTRRGTSSLAASVERGSSSQEKSPPTKRSKGSDSAARASSRPAGHWIWISHPPASGGISFFHLLSLFGRPKRQCMATPSSSAGGASAGIFVEMSSRFAAELLVRYRYKRALFGLRIGTVKVEHSNPPEGLPSTPFPAQKVEVSSPTLRASSDGAATLDPEHVADFVRHFDPNVRVTEEGRLLQCHLLQYGEG